MGGAEPAIILEHGAHCGVPMVGRQLAPAAELAADAMAGCERAEGERGEGRAEFGGADGAGLDVLKGSEGGHAVGGAELALIHAHAPDGVALHMLW